MVTTSENGEPAIVGGADQRPGVQSASLPSHEEEHPSDESIRAVYEEVCNSYHAVDEFRMKLLGLLPLTSIVGLLVLEKGTLGTLTSTIPNELVAYVSFFAAAFTLALFVYEIRGIRRSHGLVIRGRELEKALHLRGQFWLCSAEAGETPKGKAPKDKHPRQSGRLFNSKLAACFMYSLVFAAWLFVALRHGIAWDTLTCIRYAFGFGAILGVGTYLLVVRKLIPA